MFYDWELPMLEQKFELPEIYINQLKMMENDTKIRKTFASPLVLKTVKQIAIDSGVDPGAVRKWLKRNNCKTTSSHPILWQP